MVGAGTVQQQILEVLLQIKDNLGPALDAAAKKAAGFGKALDAGMRKFEQRSMALGKTMTRNVTLPIVAVGAAMTKTAHDFDKGMLKVKALAQATGSEYERLRDRAREVAKVSRYTAVQTADAMAFLAQTGLSVNQIWEVTPDVLNLAAAGTMDIARTADIATNIMKAMGIEVEEMGHLGDVLAQTFTSSNVNLEMLGDTMKYAAPQAAMLGVSVEELAAAVGIMGDAGIQASQAGTALRMGFLQLVDPPKDAQAAIDELGLTIKDAEGNFVGMASIIAQLEEGMSDLTGMERLEKIAAIFGTRASGGWGVMLDAGSEKMAQRTNENIESMGRAAEVAEEQMVGLPGAMLRLKAAWDELSISVGEAGLTDSITDLAKGLTSLALAISELPPGSLNVLIKLVAALAAFGPVVYILGALSKGLRGVAAALGWLKGVGVAIPALAVGIGLALGALFTKLQGYSWGEVGDAMRDALTPDWHYIKRVWGDIATGIWGWLKGIWQGFVEWHTQITEEAQALWNGIRERFTIGIQAIKENWSGFWSGLWDTVTTWGGNILSNIKAWATKWLNPFNWFDRQVYSGSIWPDTWKGLLRITDEYAGKIETRTSGMATNLLDEIRTLDQEAGGHFEHMGWVLADSIQTAAIEAGKAIAGLANQIAGVATTLRDQINQAFEHAADVVRELQRTDPAGWLSGDVADQSRIRGTVDRSMEAFNKVMNPDLGWEVGPGEQFTGMIVPGVANLCGPQG